MNNSETPRQNINTGRFITVITGSGTTDNIIEALRKEFKIDRFIGNSARGLTVIDSRIIGEFFYVEKSILTILAETDIADKIFEFLYHYLNIETKPGSFIYMGEVKNLTDFRMPD